MESDVITLQDIFVAKPPDEEAAAQGTDAAALAAALQRSQAALPGEDGGERRRPCRPTFFEPDDGTSARSSQVASYGGVQAHEAVLWLILVALARARAPGRRRGARSRDHVGVDATRLSRRSRFTVVAPATLDAARRRS